MKKIVIGMFIGAALAFSGQAVAETISNVGEKIDSEVQLRLDGNEVGTAIVVNGKSYSEVRKVAETMGMSVSYDASGIDLTSHLSAKGLGERINLLNIQKDLYEKNIKHYNDAILNIQNVLLPKAQKEYDEETSDFLKSKAQTLINSWNEAIQDNQAKITEYQEKLDSINQQLSVLQPQQ